MQTKQFKAESKQLLELMIHSIYSHKEVFLRELISNASDALDKRHFRSLQNKKFEYSELEIDISIDKTNRTISIKDNGIGMNEAEVEELLGTIAKSGTKAFVDKFKEAKENADFDVIGQFGVGFYSSFIVSDNVTVETKSVGNKAVLWKSSGQDSYEIGESDKKSVGTIVTLHLKEGAEFDEFLEEFEIKNLIVKYSDFIRYPIKMELTITKPVFDENGNETENTVTEIEKQVVNSQKALWKRAKKEIKEEDYDNFYKTKFGDWRNPMKTIHFNVEGTTNFSALMFIPETKTVDFYMPSYKKGIDLYSKGIFIEEECAYLIPESFKFLKGLVDSDDLNLNISREMLQKDAEITKLANTIEKKIKNELTKWMKKDKESYIKFFNEFGMQIKFAMYDNFGAKADMLKDLIMFNSSSNNTMISLSDYVINNAELDKIYYLTIDATQNISNIPQLKKFKEKNIEVLILDQEIDEFAIKVLRKYDNKEFVSILDAEVDLSNEEEKAELTKQAEDYKELLDVLAQKLTGKVSKVTLTNKLDNDTAVALTYEGEISIEMEKTYVRQQQSSPYPVSANKVLEINPNHEIFKAIQDAFVFEKESTLIDDFAEILVDQAYLAAGLEIKDVVRFATLINKMIVNKK